MSLVKFFFFFIAIYKVAQTIVRKVKFGQSPLISPLSIPVLITGAVFYILIALILGIEANESGLPVKFNDDVSRIVMQSKKTVMPVKDVWNFLYIHATETSIIQNTDETNLPVSENTINRDDLSLQDIINSERSLWICRDVPVRGDNENVPSENDWTLNQNEARISEDSDIRISRQDNSVSFKSIPCFYPKSIQKPNKEEKKTSLLTTTMAFRI